MTGQWLSLAPSWVETSYYYESIVAGQAGSCCIVMKTGAFSVTPQASVQAVWLDMRIDEYIQYAVRFQ